MGSLVRLRGVDRRGTRDGYRPSGDASAVVPDPLLVVDRLATAGVTPNFFGCVSMRVNSSYSSNLIRVRKGTGGGATFLNVGYDAGTNLLDTAALATFAAGADCYLVTIFDQSGNARDFTQATEALQCKIYDATTGTVLLGALAAPQFVGTSAAGSTCYTRADACGLTGAQAASMYAFVAYKNALSFVGTAIQCGTLSNAQRFEHGITPTGDGDFINSLSNAATRLFNNTGGPDLYDEPCGYLATLSAGAGIGTSTARQQTYSTQFVLTESQVNSGTTTCTFGTGASAIGARSNNTLGMSGYGCAWGIFGSVISGAALAVLDNFSAALCVQAYSASMVFMGQSNASFCAAQLNTAPTIAGVQWRKSSQGGQPLSYFLKGAGTGQYEEVLATIRKTPASKKIFVSWMHGESNSTVALASGYGAAFTQLAADLAADSGRSDIYWIVFVLRDDAVYDIPSYSAVAKASINTDFGTFVTSKGAFATLIDTNALTGALQADFTHYDTTLNTSAQTAIGNFVTANL